MKDIIQHIEFNLSKSIDKLESLEKNCYNTIKIYYNGWNKFPNQFDFEDDFKNQLYEPYNRNMMSGVSILQSPTIMLLDMISNNKHTDNDYKTYINISHRKFLEYIAYKIEKTNFYSFVNSNSTLQKMTEQLRHNINNLKTTYLLKF